MQVKSDADAFYVLQCRKDGYHDGEWRDFFDNNRAREDVAPAMLNAIRAFSLRSFESGDRSKGSTIAYPYEHEAVLALHLVYRSGGGSSYQWRLVKREVEIVRREWECYDFVYSATNITAVPEVKSEWT